MRAAAREARRQAKPARLPAAAIIGAAASSGSRPPRAVERDQVVAAADVGVADEDLRHGVAAGELDHGRALAGSLVDADLVDRARRRAACSSALARMQ